MLKCLFLRPYFVFHSLLMIPLHCHQRCIKEVIRSLRYNIVSLILLPVNFSALRSYIVQSHLSPNVENAYICSIVQSRCPS